jgi:hypothetical protein
MTPHRISCDLTIDQGGNIYVLAHPLKAESPDFARHRCCVNDDV